MGRPRRISKPRFLKALEGTGGIKVRIAENLECAYSTVHYLLKRKSWADMLQAYNEEYDKIGDLAEETVKEAIELRGTTKDGDKVPAMNTASKNARWLLSQKHKGRGYGKDETTINIQGGDKPVQVEGYHTVSIEELDLPLDMRRAVLEAIEKKAEEKKEREQLSQKEKDKP